MTTMKPDNWARTSHGMVTQTRRWAETVRGVTLRSWQGALSHSQVLQETTKPVFEAITTTHDQMLEVWEKGSHSAIDHAFKLADNMTPKA